jgi:hypothetical protein
MAGRENNRGCCGCKSEEGVKTANDDGGDKLVVRCNFATNARQTCRTADRDPALGAGCFDLVHYNYCPILSLNIYIYLNF